MAPATCDKLKIRIRRPCWSEHSCRVLILGAGVTEIMTRFNGVKVCRVLIRVSGTETQGWVRMG